MEQVGDMKFIDFEDALDRDLGKVGTPKRDAFESSVDEAVYSYKLGEANSAILAVKELLIIAKRLGIINQGVSENNGYGDGTLIAVNLILKLGGYNQNGIIGDNFIKHLTKLIRDKLK